MGALMEGTFLKKKEIAAICNQLEKHWGFQEPLPYLFFQTRQRRVSLLNKEFAVVDTSKLRINSVGMYFCEIMNNQEVRLSIEGSQIVGHFASRNVLSVDEKQVKQWLYGQDVEISSADVEGFVILLFGSYFIGCGRYKEGIISNHVSKNRRIGTLN